MAHRVKCDGEVFSVPSGFVNEVLNNLHRYTTDGKIDYQAIFDYLGSQQILLDHVSSLFKEETKTDFRNFIRRRYSVGEQIGYIDFDRMEENQSNKPVAVGFYHKLLDEELLQMVEIDTKTKKPNQDPFN